MTTTAGGLLVLTGVLCAVARGRCAFVVMLAIVALGCASFAAAEHRVSPRLGIVVVTVSNVVVTELLRRRWQRARRVA